MLEPGWNICGFCGRVVTFQTTTLLQKPFHSLSFGEGCAGWTTIFTSRVHVRISHCQDRPTRKANCAMVRSPDGELCYYEKTVASDDKGFLCIVLCALRVGQLLTLNHSGNWQLCRQPISIAIAAHGSRSAAAQVGKPIPIAPQRAATQHDYSARGRAPNSARTATCFSAAGTDRQRRDTSHHAGQSQTRSG